MEEVKSGTWQRALLQQTNSEQCFLWTLAHVSVIQLNYSYYMSLSWGEECLVHKPPNSMMEYPSYSLTYRQATVSPVVMASVRADLCVFMWCVFLNSDLSGLGMIESVGHSNPDGRQGLTRQEDIKPLNCNAGREWQGMFCCQPDTPCGFSAGVMICCEGEKENTPKRENAVANWLR